MAMTNIQTNRTFNVNRLISLHYWEGERFTLNSDNSVTLNATGFIQTSLVYQALNSASYRLLRIVYEGELEEASNISNKNTVEFMLQLKYYNEDGEICFERFTIPLTKESSTLYKEDAQTGVKQYVVEKVVQCTEVNAQHMTAIITNNCKTSIKLLEVSLRQSYDVQASQVSDSLSYKARLQSVVKYNNGFDLYYQGYDEPVVLTKSTDDAGNFNGVYVGANNEQFIPCSVRNFNR